MPSLIERLDAFDRKERHFLIRFVLGQVAETTDAGFRSEVGAALDLMIPDTAQWWMDYHLDWLYAALVLDTSPAQDRYPSPGFAGRFPDSPLLNVNANQEDVDVLIAFMTSGITHLILLEAKADTGWTNRQVHSKARRLSAMFPEGVNSYPGIEPHFGLCSPRPPRSLDPTPLPKWMLKSDNSIAWVPLPINPNWLKIERCDDQSRATHSGEFWRIKGGASWG